MKYANSLEIRTDEKSRQYPETGYYIYKNDQTCFILDAGEIGPDYLPAHSHPDIFSFELSVKGQKIITDTGVYEYENGGRRNYCRSTSAHNTVNIDDTDQVECWGSFRVARRYKPVNIKVKSEKDLFSFSGEYNGYSHLIGDKIKHSRNIEISGSGREIEICDKIEGSGKHLVKSFINFSPGCELNFKGNGFEIQNESFQFQIETDNSDYKILETEYFREFGIALKRKTLVLIKNCKLPAEIKYRIITP